MAWLFFIFILFSKQFLICEAFAEDRSQAKEALSSAETGDGSPFQLVQFGQGIEFQFPEKTFFMGLRFRMQNRADMTQLHHPSASEPSILQEWQTRRARVRMNGYVVNPRLKYVLQLSFSRRDQDWDQSYQPNVLRDAMIIYEVTDSWQIGFGQGKLPGNRQRVNSSGDLQFVDRSIVNGAFNIDRDFGFQTQYKMRLNEQLLIGKAAIVSGDGRNRNVTPDDQLYYIGRLEWLPYGEFKKNGDYSESDIAFEETPKVSAAYGYAAMPGSPRANGTVGTIFTTNGSITGNIVRRDLQVHFADFLFKYRGYSIATELAYRDATNARVNDKQGVLVGYGVNIQTGKMLNEKSEVALKYSTIRPYAVSLPWHSQQNDYAAVYNYFFKGHRVKLQSEVGMIENKENYLRLQFELGI